MTIIAYRNGVMAADSLVSAGGVYSGTRQKVFKTPGGILVGAAGELSYVADFLGTILDLGFDPEAVEDIPFDEVNITGDVSAILVGKDKQVWFYERGTSVFTIDHEFAVAGSGSEFATGAMAAGLSAEEAVKLTCEYVNTCGGPVQKVEL